MGTLHTFPYSDPALIPEHARLVRQIVVPNCAGDFPVFPFVGLELPSPAGRGDLKDSGSSFPERTMLGARTSERFRRPAVLPSQKDETHVSIGVGFYWWMKHEPGREFFGYPIDLSVPANRAPLSRPRILRALHALRQLPVIDVCHDANALVLSWAVARKEVEPRRMEKMVDLFGQGIVLALLASLREYRPTARELGMLKSFLYKGHIRSSRIE